MRPGRTYPPPSRDTIPSRYRSAWASGCPLKETARNLIATSLMCTPRNEVRDRREGASVSANTNDTWDPPADMLDHHPQGPVREIFLGLEHQSSGAGGACRERGVANNTLHERIFQQRCGRLREADACARAVESIDGEVGVGHRADRATCNVQSSRLEHPFCRGVGA